MHYSDPIYFRPFYKSVIWGGDRIQQLKGGDIHCEMCGESWEISAVPGSESVAINGPAEGMTLTEICKEGGSDFLGSKVARKYTNEFPLLVKIIDANDNLSVQVHPDDELAMRRHHSRGKSEMWFVIDNLPGSHIYAGLKAPLSPEEYERKVADHSIMDVIGDYHARPGQFYFIPAGTLHAIGAGCLIAEIQESSDVTYRVYDYDRRDAQGNPRQLHVAEAKDAIDYTFPSNTSPMATVYGKTTRKAVHNNFFNVDYVKIERGDYRIEPDGTSFFIVMCVKGEAEVNGEHTLRAGESALIPACGNPVDLKADDAQLLVTYCD